MSPQLINSIRFFKMLSIIIVIGDIFTYSLVLSSGNHAISQQFFTS